MTVNPFDESWSAMSAKYLPHTVQVLALEGALAEVLSLTCILTFLGL